MKNNLFLITVIVLIFGLYACKSKNPGTLDTNTVSVTHPELMGKQWKLIEIMGEPVTYPEGYANEAFIVFDPYGKIHGNLGCNTFYGVYTLQESRRLRFSQVVNTLKMCTNMDVEDKMRQVLEMVDNYSLNNDRLILNRARMAPLALFEKVEATEK
jgi:heat shock protein HslJ